MADLQRACSNAVVSGTASWRARLEWCYSPRPAHSTADFPFLLVSPACAMLAAGVQSPAHKPGDRTLVAVPGPLRAHLSADRQADRRLPPAAPRKRSFARHVLSR